VSRADELEAEGHELIARGHACFAQVARLRTSEGPAKTERPSWIPVAESPLGKRRTLALARCGAIESSKVGRKVLVRSASLAGYLDEHRRGSVEGADDENLFGSAA
jgi:hypothetical protein